MAVRPGDEAASYLEGHKTTLQILEKLLASLLLWKPESPLPFLESALAELVRQTNGGVQQLDITTRVFCNFEGGMTPALPPISKTTPSKGSPGQERKGTPKSLRTPQEGREGRMAARAKELESELAAAKNELAETTAKLTETNARLEAAGVLIERLKAEQKESEKRASELRTEVEASKEQHTSALARADALEGDIAVLQKESDLTKAKMAKEVEDLRSQLEVIKAQSVVRLSSRRSSTVEELRGSSSIDPVNLTDSLDRARATGGVRFAPVNDAPGDEHQERTQEEDDAKEKRRAMMKDKSVSFAELPVDEASVDSSKPASSRPNSMETSRSHSARSRRGESAGSRRVYTPNGTRRKTYRTDSARSALSTWRSVTSFADFESDLDDEEDFPFEDNIFALNDRYQFIQRIATNVDAVVYKAIERQTNRHIVVKIVDGYSKGREPLEIQIIKQVAAHSNIPDLLEWIPLPRRRCYALVQTYYRGDYLDSRDLRSVQTCVKHVLLALQHIHDQSILHRDVKPGNILYDSRKRFAMLIDYDCATFYDPDNPPASMIGTEGYMAPEVLATATMSESDDDYREIPPGYGFAIDVFSTGVVLAEIILNLREHGEATCEELHLYLDAVPSREWGSAHDLARKMLLVDPAQRITILDALEHPFFTEDPPADLGRAIDERLGDRPPTRPQSVDLSNKSKLALSRGSSPSTDG